MKVQKINPEFFKFGVMITQIIHFIMKFQMKFLKIFHKYDKISPEWIKIKRNASLGKNYNLKMSKKTELKP